MGLVVLCLQTNRAHNQSKCCLLVCCDMSSTTPTFSDAIHGLVNHEEVAKIEAIQSDMYACPALIVSDPSFIGLHSAFVYFF